MIKTIIKFLFAASIIFWLVQDGKLDFSLIGKSFKYGPHAIITILLITLQAIISSFRWRILLQLKADKALPVKDILKLNWIGLFFSSVLPGAVTGDLLKLVYAKELSPRFTKTFLIMSALMDRVLGLMGLLFLLGIFSIINYSEIIEISPILKNIVHFNFLLFVGVFIFFTTLFLRKKLQDKILILVSKVPILGNKLANTFEQVWIMGENKPAILKCLLLSILVQFIGVLSFWIVTHPFYSSQLSLSMIFTFVPLGLVVIAVPISPSGLGVGHAIFDKLFSFFNVTQGASLFNLFFLCIISVNFLGIIPYLLAGKRKTIEDIEEFEET